MDQTELVRFVAEALDREGVEFMITGSWASSMHGEPRSSQDVDMVIDLFLRDVPKFLAAFPEPRFYLAESAVRAAVDERGHFNLIDRKTGDKVDFWILHEEGFDGATFTGRSRVEFRGMSLPVPRPEDVIVQKLRWLKAKGESDNQRRDVLGVAKLWRDKLDWRWMEEWAMRVGVRDLLEEIRQEVMTKK